MTEWIKKDLEELNKKKQKYMEENNMQEFYKLKEGENQIKFDKNKKPRDFNSFGITKKAFNVLIEGKEWDISINPNSPLYRQILEKLENNKETLTIIRIGQGRDTKYSLKN